MTDRRQFAKIALAGATAAATIRKGSAKLTPIPPGVKIGANSVPASEDNFRYLKQLGVTWVSIAPGPALVKLFQPAVVPSVWTTSSSSLASL